MGEELKSPRRKRVTIKDVARESNISPMSVSNYLNNRFHLMSDATRQRITETIEHLGYKPSAGARGLRSQKAYSVGMIIVDPQPVYLGDPFISRVVSGLSTGLAREGYACTIQGIPDYSHSHALFSTHSRFDAVCLFISGAAADRRAFVESLSRLDEPIITFEETEHFPHLDVLSLRQADAAGAAHIAHHLLEQGARSFLMLMPQPIWPANETREKTFREILSDAVGQERVSRLTCGYGNFEAVQSSLGGWLAKNKMVDAIIANNDHIGIAALRTLEMHGIKVPEDTMVTGFNAFEFWNYSNPLLTTVVSPAYELGQRGAEAVLARLKLGRFQDSEIVLPVEFRPAASTRKLPEKGRSRKLT